MKEFFESRRFSGTIALTLSNKQKWFKDKAELCREIVEVVDRYSRSGYVLTLRQLYYQLVSMNAIRNDDVVYKKLSSIIAAWRKSSRIDDKQQLLTGMRLKIVAAEHRYHIMLMMWQTH